MNKKYFWILVCAIVAVGICAVLFVKFAPLWVSFTSAGMWVLGFVSGYAVRMLCAKYGFR